jgi:hypothetical protein
VTGSAAEACASSHAIMDINQTGASGLRSFPPVASCALGHQRPPKEETWPITPPMATHALAERIHAKDDPDDTMSDSSVVVPGETTTLAPPPLPGRGLAARPKSHQPVRFGNVEILEHERLFMDSPISGAPRLAQGRMLTSRIRRMDSLELEREPIRHHKESLQPLTPAERRDLAGIGKELLIDGLHGAAPQAAASSKVTAGKPGDGFDAALENWHLGADGSVYHGGGVTSKVVGVQGRVVTTAAHGSKYRLGNVKPQVLEVLQRLSIAFDAEAPLANPASLVYAWSICRLTPEMLECRQRVQQLEAKLSSFGPSVRECFNTIDKAFQALGFSLS